MLIAKVRCSRKLGRNIVNFSKIEGILKYLLSVSQIKGLSKSTRNQFVDSHKKFRKLTLGSLVGKLHNTVLVDDSQSEPQLDSSELGMSLSFKVTYSDSDFWLYRTCHAKLSTTHACKACTIGL